MSVRVVVDCSKPLAKQATYVELSADEEAQRRREIEDDKLDGVRRGWLQLRLVRDGLLAATDHLERDAAWATWRQDLRDLPGRTDTPEACFPEPPKAISALYEFRSLWAGLDWTPLTERTR